MANQESHLELTLDLLAKNLTANPNYARYDGEIQKQPKIFLTSTGSVEGYLDKETSAANIFYLINDHLGTPIMVLNSQAETVWSSDYTPFGQADVSVSTTQNEFRFPGQYFDGETGLGYNWHRYYDPETGRYITPDPIGLDGGINPFVYTENNPINSIDPYGLFIFPIITLPNSSLKTTTDNCKPSEWKICEGRC